MNRLKAFLLGMKEFRSSFTTAYEDLAEEEAYDWGRDTAHRLTFHYFDQQ